MKNAHLLRWHRPSLLYGRWHTAIAQLLLSVGFVITFRWALLEPFVIPSESMEPTLLVNDFIFVNKFAYRLDLPLLGTVWHRGLPDRGDVVVFESVTEAPEAWPKTHLVKRVIGLPGEQVWVSEMGEVKSSSGKNSDSGGFWQKYDVPSGHVFVLGDNRMHSSDSRVWGFLPLDHIIGRAKVIWMSCDTLLESSTRVCDPRTMRWNRLGKSL